MVRPDGRTVISGVEKSTILKYMVLNVSALLVLTGQHADVCLQSQALKDPRCIVGGTHSLIWYSSSDHQQSNDVRVRAT